MRVIVRFMEMAKVINSGTTKGGARFHEYLVQFTLKFVSKIKQNCGTVKNMCQILNFRTLGNLLF